MNKSRILIIGHTTGKHGGLESLESYLMRRTYIVEKLLHPLSDYRNIDTEFTSKNPYKIHRTPRGLINLFEDFILSYRHLKKNSYNMIIGANNFDALPAAVYNHLHVHNKVHIIYWPRDFAVNRFQNKLLNFVYKEVEKYVLKKSDQIVSNTTRARDARLHLGMDANKSIIIPNGIFLHNPVFAKKEISGKNFIYIGDVTREHGLYELIEALSPLIHKIVVISGGGDDLDRVKSLCEQKGLNAEIHSRMPHEEVIKYLQSFEGIGLAPYRDESDWTYYCSPLKVNEYIACGVPVLMSNVPEVAGTVQADALGGVYKKLNARELRDIIDRLDLTNFHLKASAFYDKYNYDKLYSKVGL